MDYRIIKDTRAARRYQIHLHHVLTDRTICVYYRTTKRKKCPTVVNDLFDEIPGVDAITLTPHMIVINHAILFPWSEMLPSVLEILRINLEPESLQVRDIDSGDNTMGTNAMLTFRDNAPLPALTSPPQKDTE